MFTSLYFKIGFVLEADRGRGNDILYWGYNRLNHCGCWRCCGDRWWRSRRNACIWIIGGNPRTNAGVLALLFILEIGTERACHSRISGTASLSNRSRCRGRGRGLQYTFIRIIRLNPIAVSCPRARHLVVAEAVTEQIVWCIAITASLSRMGWCWRLRARWRLGRWFAVGIWTSFPSAHSCALAFVSGQEIGAEGVRSRIIFSARTATLFIVRRRWSWSRCRRSGRWSAFLFITVRDPSTFNCGFTCILVLVHRSAERPRNRRVSNTASRLSFNGSRCRPWCSSR